MLKVIGAGFGRTGTMSLKLALEELGFGPCHHMVETFSHPEHNALWIELARGETNDCSPVLENYQSIVDWPGVVIWKELMAANPDAKIVLTVRDPESWYKSATATIFGRMLDFARLMEAGRGEEIDAARREHMRMVNAVVVDKSFGGSLERDHAISVFKAHNAEVRRVVPAEKLLVFESGQGWGPLCAFLDMPVPRTPYPKVNTTADFGSRFPVRR